MSSLFVWINPAVIFADDDDTALAVRPEQIPNDERQEYSDCDGHIFKLKKMVTE
jgi:hypothetical protein